MYFSNRNSENMQHFLLNFEKRIKHILHKDMEIGEVVMTITLCLYFLNRSDAASAGP